MTINNAYARTIPGIFKCVESVLDLLLIILLAAFPLKNIYSSVWMYIVAVTTIIISLFFYFSHLTNLIVKLKGPLALIEFIFILAGAVSHLLAMITAAIIAHNNPQVIAIAVLFAINMALYGVDSFFLYALFRVHGAYIKDVATTVPVATVEDGKQAGVYNTNYGYQ